MSTKFAISSIRALEEIAAILWPEVVTFHSMDDKAKVPVGITAAKKQTPLFMYTEYQVTLPDHDFVVGSKHKLIPSFIGDMKVVKSKDLTNDAVSYFGPTCIPIRSAKRSLPEFTESFQNQHSREKKVMIVTVDGGPDENPRYSNTRYSRHSNSFVSIILMHISLPKMHPEVPLTAWRDECLNLAKN